MQITDEEPAVDGRATLLIVDDTAQNLAILAELLRPLYRVRAANGGERALRAASSEPYPDLVLLDVMMPDMDGYEVLRRLRANPATQAIPVIFITGMDGSSNEEYGLSLGAVDYITKPIVPAIVLARVHTQLELKAARDRLARDNRWLEAEVARRMRENMLIRDLSVHALACLAEVRDNETGLHILRTQAYVHILATHLQNHERFAASLAHDQLANIVRAAPLHDIGKVGIPDAILLKPGPLTADEWRIMQQHPRIGGSAIERALQQSVAGEYQDVARRNPGALAWLDVARQIALHHHEKWDGSGYPDGLAGEGIPVAARLMALADVFDALVNRRVYKEPLSIERSTTIIMAGRSSHFDPAVVDAFLQCREQFLEVAARFADNDPGLPPHGQGLQIPAEPAGGGV